MERAQETVERATGIEPAPSSDGAAALRMAFVALADREPDGFAGIALRYGADVAEYAVNARSGSAPWASCAAYTSAVLAGFVAERNRATARSSAAYAKERAWQADWLSDRLGLEVGV